MDLKYLHMRVNNFQEIKRKGRGCGLKISPNIILEK
jgi:hypothetical protein